MSKFFAFIRTIWEYLKQFMKLITNTDIEYIEYIEDEKILDPKFIEELERLEIESKEKARKLEKDFIANTY